MIYYFQQKVTKKGYVVPDMDVRGLELESLLEVGSPVDTQGDPGNNQGGGGAGKGEHGEELGGAKLLDYTNLEAVDFMHDYNKDDWFD